MIAESENRRPVDRALRVPHYEQTKPLVSAVCVAGQAD